MAKNEKLNEEAAPNNNLSAATYREALFSEELSDGGDRNEMAERQAERLKKEE